MTAQNPVRLDESVARHYQIYEEFWEFLLREFPRYATYLGDHRYDDALEDASEQAFQHQISNYREYVSRLEAIGPPASTADLLNYELFRHRISLEIEEAEFHPYLMPITQQTGPHITLPQLTTYHPFRNPTDYRSFSSRLRKIPRLFSQTITNMRIGVQEGIVLPKIVVKEIVPQLDAHIVGSPEKSEFYKPVASFAEGIPADEARDLGEDVADAISGSVVPAYRELRDFVKDEYLKAARDDPGIWALADGRERYEFLIRYYTTTHYTPEHIHELGLRELERVLREMRDTMKRAGFNGTLKEYIASLRGDPTLFYSTRDALMAGFKEILQRMDAKLPLLFGRLPEARYGFREIEEYRAEAAPDAYYYRPPADGSRPGYFYVNTYKPETRPKYTMEALAYHEAVPGHHLQIAIQQELAQLPKFRRFGGYTAFVEGWALYSEQLPKEVGFYSDPLSEFGRLTFDALRAARLVVDTGIHYKRWTREETIRFMEENAALSDQTLVSEVDRYIAWPGQALAYKIGQLKILELRARAEQRLGNHFDLRAFHDELLSDGAIALDVLERKMERWLDSQPIPRAKTTLS